jgi:hypothetical protein
MCTHSSNKPKKFKQKSSARKLRATVFWDMKGMLMVQFMQQKTKIKAELYCRTLEKLCRTIQNKRHGMLTSGLHSAPSLQWASVNNCSHLSTAGSCLITLLIALISLLSDYHLLSSLKNWLRSQCFNNNEMMEGVKIWLSS